jgi:hypothetical protein
MNLFRLDRQVGAIEDGMVVRPKLSANIDRELASSQFSSFREVIGMPGPVSMWQLLLLALDWCIVRQSDRGCWGVRPHPAGFGSGNGPERAATE